MALYAWLEQSTPSQVLLVHETDDLRNNWHPWPWSSFTSSQFQSRSLPLSSAGTHRRYPLPYPRKLNSRPLPSEPLLPLTHWHLSPSTLKDKNISIPARDHLHIRDDPHNRLFLLQSCSRSLAPLGKIRGKSKYLSFLSEISPSFVRVHEDTILHRVPTSMGVPTKHVFSQGTMARSPPWSISYLRRLRTIRDLRYRTFTNALSQYSGSITVEEDITRWSHARFADSLDRKVGYVSPYHRSNHWLWSSHYPSLNRLVGGPHRSISGAMCGVIQQVWWATDAVLLLWRRHVEIIDEIWWRWCCNTLARGRNIFRYLLCHCVFFWRKCSQRAIQA